MMTNGFVLEQLGWPGTKLNKENESAENPECFHYVHLLVSKIK